MNDEALAQALIRGDEKAKEQFYRDYQKRLYATACHFLGYRDSEAEDLVHDTFVAALEGLTRFEGRSSVYTWINHICVNLCFSRLRARKRQAVSSGEEIENMLALRSQASHRAADDEAEKKERLQKLKRWAGMLAENCRKLISLRFEEGLGLNAIKERLKIPLGTVASRLARCQESLKKLSVKG